MRIAIVPLILKRRILLNYLHY